MEQETRTIWLRVGMSYTAPKDEIEALLSEENTVLPNLAEALRNGNATIDGETYIPQFVIEYYNEEHGTDFYPGDIDWYL